MELFTSSSVLSLHATGCMTAYLYASPPYCRCVCVRVYPRLAHNQQHQYHLRHFPTHHRPLSLLTASTPDYNYEETMSTLKYANRAKSIENVAVRNEDVNERMIKGGSGLRIWGDDENYVG